MTLEQVYNNIKKIAALLGIIQSTAWIVMSIICIAFYFNDSYVPNPSTYMEAVNYLMYFLFLSGDEQMFTDQTVTGRVFTAFAFIYLFLDFAWLALSIILLRKNTPKMITAWSHFTLLLSAWDMILVFIFSADYNKCLSFASDLAAVESIVNELPLEIAFQVVCADGILPVLIIVAKGFVLWIVNVCLAVVLYKISREMKQKGSNMNI